VEPKPIAQYIPVGGDPPADQCRAVPLVLPLDWAQAVTRLQQLHNEGCTLVRLLEDDRGRVRVEPGA
jgi:hypothetical protein